MNRVTRVLMVAMALPWFTASAQQSMLAGLEGKKVQLSVSIMPTEEQAGSVTIRGTVFEIRGDSLHVLQKGGHVSRIPVSSIQSLQVSVGRDRWRGALNGTVLGIGFGLFVSFMEPIECNDHGTGLDCRPDGSRPTVAQYTRDNVAFSVFLGAMIGGAVGTERWERVITRQRLTIAPARGGGIKLGWSF